MANKEGVSTRIVEKITIAMTKITIAKVGADASETGDPFECLCVSPEEGKYTTHACSSDQPRDSLGSFSARVKVIPVGRMRDATVACKGIDNTSGCG